MRPNFDCNAWFGKDRMNRYSDRKSANLPWLGPLDYAEEVSVRVFQNDEIVLRFVSPGIPLRPEFQEPFDFSISGCRVKVEVQPTPPLSTTVPCLKGQVGSMSLWIPKHNPTVRHRLSRHVVKCILPEREHPVELMAVDDDGADSHSH